MQKIDFRNYLLSLIYKTIKVGHLSFFGSLFIMDTNPDDDGGFTLFGEITVSVGPTEEKDPENGKACNRSLHALGHHSAADAAAGAGAGAVNDATDRMVCHNCGGEGGKHRGEGDGRAVHLCDGCAEGTPPCVACDRPSVVTDPIALCDLHLA